MTVEKRVKTLDKDSEEVMLPPKRRNNRFRTPENIIRKHYTLDLKYHQKSHVFRGRSFGGYLECVGSSLTGGSATDDL